MVRRLILAIALLVAVAGSSANVRPLVSSVHAAPAAAPAATHAALFDKTRVVIHLAVAYGVFHHWVYNPFRAGDLGIKHPIKLAKAGLALLFAVHEVKKAISITSGSSSPTLKALNKVLLGVQDKFTSVGNLFHKDASTLTGAQVSSSVNDLNGAVNQSNSILKAPDAPVAALGNFQ